jgi:hypothetical protein
LDKLAKADCLPKVFVEMADHLRALGNLGAHEDDVELEAADADVAAEFAEAILEYLYRVPARVEHARASLAARIAEAKAAREFVQFFDRDDQGEVIRKRS